MLPQSKRENANSAKKNYWQVHWVPRKLSTTKLKAGEYYLTIDFSFGLACLFIKKDPSTILKTSNS